MMHATERGLRILPQNRARKMWQKMMREYQQELQGIVEGLRARTVELDVMELRAFTRVRRAPGLLRAWLNKDKKAANARILKSPGMQRFCATEAGP